MLGSFSNGGLGFGVAFNLDYDSSAAQEIMRDLQRIDGVTEQVTANIETAMNRIQLGAGMAAVGAALLAPLKMGADVRAEFQAYEVQFETLLKSAEAAKAAINNIKQDAIDSPVFGTKSLVAANAALVSNGIEANRSRGIINDLGNALAGVGRGDAELSSMAVNLQQIASNGKASSMDIKQFAMAGLPIYKMLADSTGKSVEELREMDITLEDLQETFRFSATEAGMFYKATERAANSTKGLKAALDDGIELTLERIGAALEPITRDLYQGLGALMNRVREFVSTPLGARIVRIVAALGAFLVVGGSVLVLMGTMRLAAFKMAGAFTGATKATIIQTLATQGLAAGFRQMGIALWTAVSPLLLVAAAILAIYVVAKQAWGMMQEGDERTVKLASAMLFLLGPIGLVVWAISGITRGFAELDNWTGDKGGMIGFFMRVAGVIRAVVEIWESFNGETFTLTEELASKLEAMGILDFVINLGTWIARIQTFFSGLVKSLQAGWEELGTQLDGVMANIGDKVLGIFDRLGALWETIKELFAPIVDMIEVLLEKLGFGKGALSDWGTAGEIVGDIIIFVLSSIIDTLALVIDIILWTVDTFIYLVDMMLSGINWIVDGIMSIVDAFMNMLTFLWDLTTYAFNFGVDFMTAIWEGFKSIWASISEWLMEKVGGALKVLANPLGAIADLATGQGSAVASWLSGDDGEDNPVAGGGTGMAMPMGNNPSYSAFTSKTVTAGSGRSSGGTNPVAANAGGNETYSMPIYIDGDKVADNVFTKQQLKNSRQ